MNWRKTAIAAILSAGLVLSALALPVAAADPTAAAQETDRTPARPLTDAVLADLKGAFSERTPEGSVFGVVVGLESVAAKVTRVPDYELRVHTTDGTVYTLAPSLANPRALQPKSKAELGYVLHLDHAEPLKAAKLEWVEIDEYVYPRKETTLLLMDIEGSVWEAGRADFEAAGLIPWGEEFRLDKRPEIRMATKTVEKRATAQGGVYVVTVTAENESEDKRYVPDFALSGTDGRKLFAGTAALEEPLLLNPGEAKNLHIAIQTDEDTQLKELIVTTPEQFVTAPHGPAGAMQSDVYQIGRVRIALPPGGEKPVKAVRYEYGTPIRFDPLNDLIGKDLRVALMELHLHENQGDGYQTAIAKFKLQNVGKNPVPMPDFGAELVSASGNAYAGQRQLTAAAQLMPELSHIVSYAFNVPKTETGERYTLRILDETAAASHAAAIAALDAEVQSEQEENVWHLYPFNVKLNHWTVQAYTDSVPVISYSYKMILDLDIELSEEVVVDAGFSKLKIELADSQGRTLGSEVIPFTGPGRLISGKQTILFSQIRTEQHQYPITVNIYETIDTPGGESNRFIQTLNRVF